MTNIEELIRIILGDLDPVSLMVLKKSIEENLVDVCLKKDSTAKIISANKINNNWCDECGCVLHKNGHTKAGVQKYICLGCKNTYSERTGTVSCGSNLPFEIWKSVIDNVLNGFSIRRIARKNNISVDTSFRLRHKILKAIEQLLKDISLKGKVWSDAQYFSLNFKGTKPDNMPRISKKRASRSSLTGISHHKVCVIGAIDENDNLIFKIGGLGKGKTDMLEKCIGDKVEEVKEFTTDSATAYIEFCNKHNIKLKSIPSGFYSDGIENLSEINNVHSQLTTWLSKFRGISTRHLQSYLNWFSYVFMMLKKFEIGSLKIKNYKDILLNNSHIKSIDICKSPLLIDPMVAYAEYHNQSIS